MPEENDLEFEALVQEFTTDISAAEFTSFEDNVPVSEPLINDNDIDWRERQRQRERESQRRQHKCNSTSRDKLSPRRREPFR